VEFLSDDDGFGFVVGDISKYYITIWGIHVRQLKGQICKLAKFSVTNQEYNSNTKSKPLYIFGAALR